MTPEDSLYIYLFLQVYIYFLHFLLSLSDACNTSSQRMQQRSLRIRNRTKMSRIRNNFFLRNYLYLLTYFLRFLFIFIRCLTHLLAADAATLVAELAEEDGGGSRGRRFSLLFLRGRQQHHSLKIKQFWSSHHQK